jgi:hypothetical protein
MPVVFDEISGEVAPERSAGRTEQHEQSAAQGTDPAELVRRDLQLERERSQRLIAD